MNKAQIYRAQIEARLAECFPGGDRLREAMRYALLSGGKRIRPILTMEFGRLCGAAPETVLDVACGTGVLFGDYVKRGAARVTAVDLSPEMAARAAEKAAGTQITVVCGDVEDSAAVRDSGPYDVVMVYNAFPHFPDPAGLIQTLAGLVRPGGRLSIAHGMSRAALDAHHSGSAKPVSLGLLHEDEVRALMAPYLDVDTVISNGEMYQVCGRKRA